MSWYSRVQACRATWSNRDKRRWRKTVKCYQWLTNQIAEAPLHWRREPTSIHVHQVSVADTSCGKPPVYSCRRPRGSMFLYLRAEQTLSVLGTGVLWCWYWENCKSIHTLCREFITEQASPILRRTPKQYSRVLAAVVVRTLLTAKVDELFYSFNWYTIYENCRRRVTCTHVLELAIAFGRRYL